MLNFGASIHILKPHPILSVKVKLKLIGLWPSQKRHKRACYFSLLSSMRGYHEKVAVSKLLKGPSNN